MTTEERKKAALVWLERREAVHSLTPYDLRGEGYPEIFEILETIRELLQPTPQNREADMPDTVWIREANFVNGSIPVSTKPSSIFKDVKYIRADLANKPALDAEVVEAIEYMRKKIAYAADFPNPKFTNCIEVDKLETLIRAASAVQEEITSKHFTEERKWALNRDVVAFLDILPANGYKIVKERKDV